MSAHNMEIIIPRIYSVINGFQNLAQVYQTALLSPDAEICFQMPDWFDADMLAILGGIFTSLISKGKRISLIWQEKDRSKDKLRQVALKNLFLKRMGIEEIAEDINKTTIEFQIFQPQQGEEFNKYVSQHFIPGKKGLIKMSDKVLKEIRRGIFELYDNASDHSGTREGIFVCGQFFPNKEELHFIVADLGIGVAKRIKENLEIEYSPEEALRWAFKTGNTTRKGANAQGLKNLKEAIESNKGSIQFVSYRGYLSIDGKGETFKLLDYPFPGTAVCIKFRTNDKNTYYFKDELNSTKE